MRERWVIVDDGSTDRTVGNCAGLCETLSLDRNRFSLTGRLCCLVTAGAPYGGSTDQFLLN